MELFLEKLERALWGWPLLGLLLGAGLWLTVRLRFLPIRRLPRAMGLVLRKRNAQTGGVSAFGALCTALSATIGTGNIVGVATALSLGGPGALLWMELSALTGLSLKYAEGLLAVKYRRRDGEGRPCGGPYAYITLGLGRSFRPLAAAFAVCGAAAGLFGVGTFVQVGSVSACLTEILAEHTDGAALTVLIPGTRFPLWSALLGLGLALLAAVFLFGGIQRISRLSSKVVPLMGGVYVLCCLWILARNAAALPAVAASIFRTAFRPESAGAGLLGTVAAGVSRGVFSNEAGLGTAPIAAAAAEGVTPAEQGLISMSATVFDTFLICTLTGLVILTTGSGGAGISAAMLAFARGLPLPKLVSECLVLGVLALFSFTTVLGWSCYGTACLDDLTGGASHARRVYLILYALTVAVAPLCPARGIWTAANICNGLMAVPNLLGILLLSRRIAECSRSVS